MLHLETSQPDHLVPRSVLISICSASPTPITLKKRSNNLIPDQKEGRAVDINLRIRLNYHNNLRKIQTHQYIINRH
ncbi:hypothetical protein Pan54_09320 [Rubinisphaera italica]|uniref:Uncharacterized protein n=1 Tax=Rubinisphaera italica TaxID=2527969 RepID=A0A5C5XBQ6_9PLAN|nr:hypothetical protein Pan54_09320 [Rubinisphaera italica]